MITRRAFFKRIGQLALTGIAAGTYAFIIEPGFRLRIQSYAFTPPHWTRGLKLRVVLLSDPHLIEPHMPASRWRMIIETANALQPDLNLLLGDYLANHRFSTGKVAIEAVADEAKRLHSKLGTFAIMGNHDWWEDKQAQKTGVGPIHASKVFEAAGIPVLENMAQRLIFDVRPFWLTGTSSMIAIRRNGYNNMESRADIAATMAQITDDAPIIHMAHEPDLFVDLPDRISLTVSGHTHGGQVRLFGWSPVVPSMYGNRFAYGHIEENGRHLIVSGGLGCSIAPVRFGSPPEITVLELG